MAAFKDRIASALVVLVISSLVLPVVWGSPDLGYWWGDPCDKLRKVRHQGSQQVLTQLNNVITNLNRLQLPQVKEIFNATVPGVQHLKKYAWLRFPKFTKKGAKKLKNKNYALAEVHKALQIYSGTIYTLINNTQIVTEAYYNAEKASMLLNSVAYELKRLTCEVTNELDEKNIKSSIMRLQDMKITLPKTMNLSQAHVAYESVLKSYKLFLKRSKALLFGKGRRKKPKNRSSKQ